nr:MAG TPA: hypothetical protein [Caudoviricetes sp.]
MEAFGGSRVATVSVKARERPKKAKQWHCG